MRWWHIGQRTRASQLTIALLFVISGQVAAKELWNTLPPAPNSAQASAQIIAAIAAGYDAFKDSELKGIDARKEGLRFSGEELLKASVLMAQTLDTMRLEKTGFNVVNYDSLDQQAQVVIGIWLDSLKAEKPKTVLELYELAAYNTKILGEQIVSWSDRTDDGVFSDYINTTSLFLQAGAAGSRIFEKSP